VAEVLNIEQVSPVVTFESFGGADRDRTDDILLAKQALSQLSYSPIIGSFYMSRRRVVGLGRFELPTSPLSGVRSSQLSYRPLFRASRQAAEPYWTAYIAPNRQRYASG
jgi:hypothetical protein